MFLFLYISIYFLHFHSRFSRFLFQSWVLGLSTHCAGDRIAIAKSCASEQLPPLFYMEYSNATNSSNSSNFAFFVPDFELNDPSMSLFAEPGKDDQVFQESSEIKTNDDSNMIRMSFHSGI